MSDATVTYRPAQFRRVLVADAEALRQVTKDLQQADAVGVDLEMVQRVQRQPGGYQQWAHVLALIQVASDTVSAVIDPLRCGDLSPLRPLMAGPIRKVFLGGGQDAALLEGAGIGPRTVVDVGEVALALFGRREDGMAALARRIFGISLDKTVRRADWLARPINPALLTYAHQDAELTVLIYRWFRQHYPDVVELHQRAVLDPPIPDSLPAWLVDALSRPSAELSYLLAEHHLDPERDVEALTADVQRALGLLRAPRQINRMFRVAGELRLVALLPEVLLLLDSRSSLMRASAARAVGLLAEPEEGRAALEPLRNDPIEDVRRAAGAALRDLEAPQQAEQGEEEADTPSLGGDALSALQRLREQLESDAE